MPTLLDIVQQIRKSEQFDVRALETRVIEQITTRTGAKRGAIAGRPSIFVQPITLDPAAVAFNLDTSIDWVVKRIKETGTRIFDLSLGQQQSRLVLIAQWPRTAQSAAAA